ncbi:NUDIX domain protein [Methylibium sp. T29]|nr:NUDIX domain protein [Methylibium sp. T29]
MLRAHAPWLQERDDGVLSTALRDEALDAAFAVTHAALRERGLITGWRNETYAVVPAWGAPVLARIERAAARFWGTLTFGAHANGYVAGPDGRPSHLWIAQRSPHKPTDPGKFDNLIGGGVPHGQTPFETLVREGWEEAGLAADLVRRATRAGSSTCSGRCPTAPATACSASSCSSTTWRCRPACSRATRTARSPRCNCCRWPRRWHWRAATR